MSKENPKAFRELSVEELRRSAVEDFAVDAKPTDNKETVLAALQEAGVKWSDYVLQHPEVAPAVVKSSDLAPKGETANVVEVTPETVGEPEAVVVTAQPVRPQPGEVYLIKMTRENPLYQTRGHRFTQEHPYALVSAADADYILTKEDGFRQATPSELREYYG